MSISPGSAVSCLPAGLIGIVEEPVAYAAAWDYQLTLHQERSAGVRPDTLLILEHRPVYTLGRRTDRSHWGGREDVLRANGADVQHVTRGGSVTYHGPGQIVLYPILRLTSYASGPKQFVRLLEDVVLRLLRRWNIAACRREPQPGVWIGDGEPAKIASIGIRVERGITLHGIAVNVDMDLLPFHLIHPCGITGGRMTSMARASGKTFDLREIKQALAQEFGRVFAVQWPVEHMTTLSPTSFCTSRSHART